MQDGRLLTPNLISTLPGEEVKPFPGKAGIAGRLVAATSRQARRALEAK